MAKYKERELVFVKSTFWAKSLIGLIGEITFIYDSYRPSSCRVMFSNGDTYIIDESDLYPYNLSPIDNPNEIIPTDDCGGLSLL